MKLTKGDTKLVFPVSIFTFCVHQLWVLHTSKTKVVGGKTSLGD